MTVLTERKRCGNFILTELSGTLSRDTITVDVPAGARLEPGTVLGIVAATEHYAPYDDSASDGTETAAGILYAELDNAAGLLTAALTGVVINFGAEVRAADLVWGAGVDEAAGLADLAAVAIKARD